MQGATDLSLSREGQESDGQTTETVEDISPPSDPGAQEKDDVKQESEVWHLERSWCAFSYLLR